jgi:hypothetical protein
MYLRVKGSMLKKSPSSFFLKIPRGIRTRGTTSKFECFPEFKSEFENNLGYESGIHMGSIHEKNKRPKISCYCPFNVEGNSLGAFLLLKKTRKVLLYFILGLFRCCFVFYKE